MRRGLCYCGVHVTDSSCGVSVCLVKPRRLIEWWRLSPHATVTATVTSSSQLVSFTKYTSVHFLPGLCLRCVEEMCVHKSGRVEMTTSPFCLTFLLSFIFSPHKYFSSSLTLYLCEIQCSQSTWWTLCCFLLLCACVSLYYIRHVLHPVICYHHAQHQPPQPKCEGQDHSGAFHLHEQRHQQRRGFT